MTDTDNDKARPSRDAQAEGRLAETLDRATPANREDDEELTYEEMHFDGFPPDAQILHITYEKTEPRAEKSLNPNQNYITLIKSIASWMVFFVGLALAFFMLHLLLGLIWTGAVLGVRWLF